jgi:hypothetical protein
VIVRPDVYEKYRRTIRQSNTLIIEGQLQKEGAPSTGSGQAHIDVLARKVWAFDASDLTEGVRARNFH